MEEINCVLGNHRSENLCLYEDLGKLEYLGQTLKESLRLHPPIGAISRYCEAEIELGGFKIPAGTYISVSQFVIHHSEEVWLDAKKFNPDRFNASKDGNIMGNMYFPFSIGPRSCIGKTFAQFEAKVLIARLYQDFEVELVPGQKLVYEETLTVRPRDGVFCTVKRR